MTLRSSERVQEMKSTIDALRVERAVAADEVIVLDRPQVVDLNVFERVVEVADLGEDPLGERGEPALKRAFDLILAGLGLLLSAPLWALVALMIKLDDRGPIFYHQRRWGKDGVSFGLYKFRTMKVGCDDGFGIRQAAADDERVTRAGRFLRRTGMDELPQLINILKGDMSLVGPRALAIGEILVDVSGRPATYEEVPGFEQRLLVRPGLTGMATIHIPKDAPPSEKLFYDLRYIRERSLALDAKLVALSVWISILGRWESPSPKP